MTKTRIRARADWRCCQSTEAFLFQAVQQPTLSLEDPRKRLELHHVKPHVAKGKNTEDNLETLCNVHHDALHGH